MDKSNIARRLKVPTKFEISAVSQNILKEIGTNNTTSTKSTNNLPSLSARRARRSKSFCFPTNRSLNTLKPAISTTNLANAKAQSRSNSDVPSSSTSTSLTRNIKDTGTSKKLTSIPSNSSRNARRSKSFCLPTQAAATSRLKSTCSSSTNLAKSKLATILPVRSANASRPGSSTITNKPVTSRINTGLTKTAAKRPATTTTVGNGAAIANCPSAPKISKFDYKGRFNLLDEKYKALVVKHREVKGDYETLQEESRPYKETIQQQKEKVVRLETQLQVTKEECQSFQSKLHNADEEIIYMRRELESKLLSLEEYKNKLRQSEEIRRVLHNQVQDLKGTIRVICRVRPMNADEEDRLPCILNYPDESTLEIKKSKESISSIRGASTDLRLQFNFDRVFGERSSQSEVFEDLSQLVQSTLDGYNVCVFAYGQTGSGKTYTMLGSADNLGMIPRSIDLLFSKIKELEESGWMYEVQVNFLEIYNETIKDLLNPSSKKPHDILYNVGKAVVTNLTTETVTSAGMLKKHMALANRNRAVAATDFNLHSSRSHAVTKITVQGYYDQNEFHGSINLVDLAGSESAKNSDRMAETKSINKSLSTLGTVMLSLHNKDTHIPYRNSKLTYLLQSCLGGNSKTLMFVNISPLEECYNETINSLRFAAQVKDVKTLSKRNKIQSK